MNQNHFLASQLVDLRRRELLADADQHRPVHRDRDRSRLSWRRR
jgi:hypothetical protein